MPSVSAIGRVSFPALFEPSEFNGRKTFNVTLLFKKDDPFIAKLKGEIDAAIKEKWGNKVPSDLKLPVKDGDAVDEEKDGDRPEYKGHYAVKFTCNENRRPGVIDQHKNEIMDRSMVYAGCYGRVSYSPYAYVHEQTKAKGVRLTLANFQFAKDGERFDGSTDAESDFDALPDETAGAGSESGKHLF